MKKFEEKLIKEFPSTITYKSAMTSTLVNFLTLDESVKHALIGKFINLTTGELDVFALNEYLKKYYLSTGEWNIALMDLQEDEGSTITILTQVKIVYDTTLKAMRFILCDLGSAGVIDSTVVRQHRSLFSQPLPIYGEATFCDYEGIITMVDFYPIQDLSNNLLDYKHKRAAFTTEEWTDVLLSGLNFDPSTFPSMQKKLCLLQRFMPLVEKRLNMIELTIKGNSKSYCYSLSPYQKLATSSISRANAFYNNSTKTKGFFSAYDAVAFDEIQTFQCRKGELFPSLKTYLENGQINAGVLNTTGDAGLVLVGNYYGDGEGSLFQELDKDLQEPAFIDRFGCLIQGEQIERMSENRKYCGVAFSSNYLAKMFHELRDDFYYRAIVDELITIKGDGDTRNIEAVKKSSCAMMKILFPHVQRVADVNIEEFKEYCLKPAIVGREGILKELRKIDSQYENVIMPTFVVAGEEYEGESV